RAEVEIVRTQAQRGPHHNFIEYRSGSVNEKLAAVGGAHDSVKVARVDRGNGDRAFFTEKAASTVGVAVAAPNMVALAVEQLCEKRACRPGPQDEDAHGVGKLYHRLGCAVFEPRAMCFFDDFWPEIATNCAEFVEKRKLKVAPTGAA